MTNPLKWPLRRSLIALISLCLFLQLLLSNRLWYHPDRMYPKLPFIAEWPVEFGTAVEGILFIGLLLGLFLLSLGFRKMVIFPGCCLCLFLLVLEDVNRLQVWVYQLWLFLLFLFSKPGRRLPFQISFLRIGVIGVYWWSGIQKWNVYFTEDIFPWMVGPLGIATIMEEHPSLGLVAAVFESLLGVGLLLKKSRKVTVFLAIIFHLLILYLLGPLGHNWNAVVWPWNLCMMGLVYLLFYHKEEAGKPEGNVWFKELSILTGIVIFGILPGLNFINLWSDQLSFKMYSGHSIEGVFYFKGEEAACFSKEKYNELIHYDYRERTKRIILDEWAFEELNVAPFKSRKRIIQAAEKLCDCMEKTEIAGLEILQARRWNKSDDEFIIVPCSDLKSKSIK